MNRSFDLMFFGGGAHSLFQSEFFKEENAYEIALRHKGHRVFAYL